MFAKAHHSQQKNLKFYDKKAIEVISKIDYDFTLAKKDRKMNMGVIGRTIVLDDMVGEYIRNHPHCTVINIASGMDTRFNRLDNGLMRGYNVDLENSANFRLKYIEDTDRVKTLAYSAMDEKWADFAAQGLRTLGYAILISAGILVIHTIMNAYRAWKADLLL